MKLDVPKPRDVFDVAMNDGAIFHMRCYGDADADVRMFISHGNGFAADGYVPFWESLANRFELIVFDFRNHGRNARSDPANHHYDQMARDVGTVHREVTEKLEKKKNVGVFHSMSSRAAMKHAVEIEWVWDALILFDPPNVPPPGHRVYDLMDTFEHRLADWALSRTNRYAAPADLAADYLSTRAHASWVEGAHELMARAVLFEDQQGGDWQLKCPRELESSIYLAAMTMDLWPNHEAFGGPVKLIAADPEAKGAPGPAFANRALAEDFGYDYEAIPETGHLLQIQKPEACRRSMRSFLAEKGVV